MENMRGTRRNIPEAVELMEARYHETQWFIPGQKESAGGDWRRSLRGAEVEAEEDYDEGMRFFNSQHFSESIPCFLKALSRAKVPEFYIMLCSAYLELDEVSSAEDLIIEGLSATNLAGQEPYRAVLSSLLGQVCLKKGDRGGALNYLLKALELDIRELGPNHPAVATDANNIGQVLQDMGDIERAVRYTRRALEIDEAYYGLDHPSVAVRVNNLGQMLFAEGAFDEALQFTERALQIDERAYGSDHPYVAIDVNNLGQIHQAKGNLDLALQYAERAMYIDERFYGPGHQRVALRAISISQLLEAQRDQGRVAHRTAWPATKSQATCPSCIYCE